MTRILYLSSSYIPSRGADSVHVMRMCAALAREGHEVELAYKRNARRSEPAIRDAFAFYGVEPRFDLRPVRRPSASGGGLVFTAGLLRRLLGRRAGPDLVYAREVTGAVLASALGYRTVFEAHGVPKGRLSRWLHRRLLASSAVVRIVVISQALRERFLAFAEAANLDAGGKLLVAHDAADPLPDATDRPESLTGEAPKIGYVGHLYPGRGVGLIEELARRLPECAFHLIGGRPEDLERRRAASATPANLHYHGFVPPARLAEIYACLDILLMPYQRKVGVKSGRSDTAAWMSPMKMFEYMSTGKPIVASDLPVLGEVLRDGDNALLVGPEDPRGWETAVRRLLDDGDLAERLGRQARSDFLAHHTWDARARAVLDGIVA